MLSVFMNQKKNNMFFNVLNECNNKIFYNTVGLEGFSSKSVSSSLMDFLLYKMFTYLELFMNKNYYSYNSSIFLMYYNKEGVFFKKKKIFFLMYLNMLNNFNHFLYGLTNNLSKLKIKVDNFFFLNNFSHGGNNCKFKKWWK